MACSRGVLRAFVAGAAAALLIASAAEHPAPAADTTQEPKLLWRDLPGKEEDVTTVTKRYRADLVAYCRGRGCRNLTAVEVGCYLGYTTSVLSRLFSRVFVLDNKRRHLDAARSLNRGRTNVVYLRFELYSGLQHFDWSELLAGNDVHVAVVDAGHRYDQVTSDIQSALRLASVDTVILDDYVLVPGVRQAVDAFVEAGMLRCEAIGEDIVKLFSFDSFADAWWWWASPRSCGHVPCLAEKARFLDIRGLREGMLCTVVARSTELRWGTALNGVRYACYAVSDWSRRKGMPMWQADVTVKVLSNSSVLLSWPPGQERETVEVKSEIVDGHILRLKSEVPPLARTIFFDPWLRRGFSLRGGVPEHMCLLVEDLYGLAEWTLGDVLGTPDGPIWAEMS